VRQLHKRACEEAAMKRPSSLLFMAFAISGVGLVAQTVGPPSAIVRRVGRTTLMKGASATRINNHGEVVLRVGRDRTFLWASGVPTTEIRFGGDYAFTAGTALSGSGNVVGEALSPRGFYEPFIWSRGGGIRLVWSAWEIENRSPTAVNDADEVVGPGAVWNVAYRVGPTTGMIYGNPLGLPQGPCTSTAVAISEWGESVGASTIDLHYCDDSIPGPMHAYRLRRDGSVLDLGTLGGRDSAATAINDRGQITGWSLKASGAKRAFFWSAATRMVNLGTLGGGWSQATAINNLGQVIGTSETSSGKTHGFIWSLSMGMVDVGAGAPAAINDLGQVVGTVPSSTHPVAYFWSRVDGRTDFAHFAQVLDINDRAEVVGGSNIIPGPGDATLWRMAVVPAETINWYQARTAALLYGGAIDTAQGADYSRWIVKARASLSSGDAARFDRYLGKLRAALGQP
jgi:probable HAF family extracellular repeat protein